MFITYRLVAHLRQRPVGIVEVFTRRYVRRRIVQHGLLHSHLDGIVVA